MDTFKSFESLLSTVNDQSFDDIALSLFQFQAENNLLYGQFIKNLSIRPKNVTAVSQIPFLPISFFKNHVIKTGHWSEKVCYTSSGTTGQATSKHVLPDPDFYLENARRCFDHFFGAIEDYHFLAYLPSYLERSGSSLIAMMDYFIQKSTSTHSGFYLNNEAQLLDDLEMLRTSPKKTILWGVSFALLALAEKHTLDLNHCLIFETGGMKGRRKEITRHELHEKLLRHFNVPIIYSEYGMTELLSQAYSKGGVFKCSPVMKVLARDITDPFSVGIHNETGGLNVIDLANIHSIAFIETEDIGKVYQNGAFEVLGRIDNSDVRGCNLLLE